MSPEPPAGPELPVVVVRPTTGFASLGLGELLRYRELVYFLAWRDVKVRYKEAALGVLWAVLRPVLAMAVFALVFGRQAGFSPAGIPYALFAYAALLPWGLFAHALNESSQSLIMNEKLVTKVYFPRLAVPLSTIAAGLVDFVIGLVVFFPLLLWYGRAPGIELLLLPVFTLLAAVTALGMGLWLAALNVRYRDVRHAVPYLTQLWMFATPIVYPTSLVPESWRPLFALNPLTGVVEGFRLSLLGYHGVEPAALALSCAASVIIALSGAVYFRRMERTFADTI